MKVLSKIATGSGLAIAVSMPAFATAPGFVQHTESGLPYIGFSRETLMPVLQSVVSNISYVIPFAIGLLALVIGWRVIPGILNRFSGH